MPLQHKRKDQRSIHALLSTGEGRYHVLPIGQQLNRFLTQRASPWCYRAVTSTHDSA